MNGNLLLFLSAFSVLETSLAWTSAPHFHAKTAMSRTLLQSSPIQDDPVHTSVSSRRSWLIQSTLTATAALGTFSNAAVAADTSSAQVTDRIFVEVKGLGPEPKRIIIGLFGKDAPKSTQKLKQLVNTKEGLPAPCKPKTERALQKEQLEANKVYNTCMESQDKGVNYEYSQIWRIIPNDRIDVGAVSGRFIAREYPNWQEDKDSGLRHDSPGVVSVRKGNDSGFGFTIYPGGGNPAAAALLDEEHIVVGKVENLEVVKELNSLPVITSSKVSYMGLTGGPSSKSAPSRACTYGGAMYCNEYKPLNKLSILNSGIL